MTTPIGNIHQAIIPEDCNLSDPIEQLHILKPFENDLEDQPKGSVIIVYRRPDLEKPISCAIWCPDCGMPSFTITHAVITDKSQKIVTLTPSIILQCCGYHGWLKNNVFTKV